MSLTSAGIISRSRQAARCADCRRYVASEQRRTSCSNGRQVRFYSSPQERSAGYRADSASTSHRNGNSKRSRWTVYPSVLAGSALVGVVAWCFFSWDFPKRLSYSYFVPLRVASIEAVTSETSLIRIHLPETLLPDTSAYPEPPDQPLQAVYVRQPELQIQRAYTPLSVDCFRDACSNVTKRGNTNHSRFIELLVKRYSDGEVSSYLHRLNTGDEVFVRGPVRTWTLPDCDELVYIAGGTGITPLIQLLSAGRISPKKVKLLYATSKPDTSLLRPFVAEDVECREMFGRPDLKTVDRLVGRPDPQRRTQIIVCGPEGFIASLAGPISLNAAKDPVGGHLATLGWTEQHVKKL